MKAYSFLKTGNTDALLLSALCWVVFEDSIAKDMELSLIEDINLGKEGAVRVFEGIWQEETEDQPRRTGKGAHKYKQPEPPSSSCHAAHVKDTIC